MLFSQAALRGMTGSFEISVFQTLSAGNIGQIGAPQAASNTSGSAPAMAAAPAAAGRGARLRWLARSCPRILCIANILARRRGRYQAIRATSDVPPDRGPAPYGGPVTDVTRGGRRGIACPP